MGDMFSMDNPVMNFLEKLMNLMILNVCFLVSCIPVITIGAAWTALFTVNLRMVKKEEAYVFRTYWNAFAKNFKQSTKIWLFVLVAG